MAGSRKLFVYTDDAEVDYWIDLDESNTEAVNGNSLGYPTTGGPVDAVPRNIKPRELFYINTARTRTIRVVALTPAIYTAIIQSPGTTINDPLTTGQLLYLSRGNGERNRIPVARDTGLDDGDQP